MRRLELITQRKHHLQVGLLPFVTLSDPPSRDDFMATAKCRWVSPLPKTPSNMSTPTVPTSVLVTIEARLMLLRKRLRKGPKLAR